MYVIDSETKSSWDVLFDEFLARATDQQLERCSNLLDDLHAIGEEGDQEKIERQQRRAVRYIMLVVRSSINKQNGSQS